MIRILFLAFLFFQSVNSSADQALSPDSAIFRTLIQYQAGKVCAADLAPTGAFSGVNILGLTQAEIELKAGHDGGGIRQNPSTNKYEIFVNKDLPTQQKAHAICHELQHVRDEIAFDDYLRVHPSLNAIGPEVIKALRGEDAVEFVKKNPEKVAFVIAGLYCQERRAYEINLNLHKQGLEFANKGVLVSTKTFIQTEYVNKIAPGMFAVSDDMESKCVGARDFSTFMNSMAPSSSSSNKASSPAAR